MKISKEAITGIVVALTILAIITFATGIYGLLFTGLAFLIAVISVNLFSRKSVVAKTGAVVLNTDLIYKILMPGKYRRAIEELGAKERHKDT